MGELEGVQLCGCVFFTVKVCGLVYITNAIIALSKRRTTINF